MDIFISTACQSVVWIKPGVDVSTTGPAGESDAIGWRMLKFMCSVELETRCDATSDLYCFEATKNRRVVVSVRG